MSQRNSDGVKESEPVARPEEHQPDCGNPKDEAFGDSSMEEVEVSQESNENQNPMPSERQEEEAIKRKYGGLLPKKPPLISKDHERAFFDSADWALGKQGAQKPKGPLESLRPKLQPTPQQHLRSRRSAYAPADDTEGNVNDLSSSNPEDQSCCTHDGGAQEDNSSHEAARS